MRTAALPLIRLAVCVALARSGISVAPAQQTSESEIVWPTPPDPARIRYVGFVRSESDVGRKGSFFGKIKRAIVGGSEQTANVLVRPHDVHTDEAGRIYVSDRAGGGRLIRFDPGDRDVVEIDPEGAGRFAKPMGLGGRGLDVFVTDPVNRRVVALDGDGKFRTAYGGAEELLNPVDVAVSPSGDRIYVADSYLHQVVIFAADGTLLRKVGRDAGDLAAKRTRRDRAREAAEAEALEAGADADSLAAGEGVFAGGHGSGGERKTEPSDMVENRGAVAGEFRFPAHVACAPDGRVYVSDGMNFRVQVLDAEGEYLDEIGQLGQTPGSFARPKGVGVDEQGHVYVCDAAFNNVQIFDPEGRLLMAFGEMGPGHGEFWQPLGLGVTGDRVFVVDRFNNRVQIFDYLDVSTEDLAAPPTRSPEGGEL